MPIDLMFGRPEDEPPQTATDYASVLQEQLERVHEFARGHMQLMSNRMKQRYDSNALLETCWNFLDFKNPVVNWTFASLASSSYCLPFFDRM